MWSVSEWRYVFLAAVVTVFAAMPVAIAGAAVPDANANATVKKTNKRIGALNKKVRALEASMDQRLAALEGRSSAKPSGPAGGDLTGAYPNPLIAPNAVGFNEIAAGAVGVDEIADGAVLTAKLLDGTIGSFDLANDSVTEAEIADGGIGAAELSPGSVHAGSLGPVEAIASAPVLTVPGGIVKTARVDCPVGTRLLSGGFEWEEAFPAVDAFVISSSPSFTGDPARTWEVRAGVRDGGGANRIIAEALCLRA